MCPLTQLGKASANPLLSEVQDVLERVATYKQEARQFYWEVLLSAHACPECGGSLYAAAPGRCTCRSGHSLDPTLAFQRSPCCQAGLRKLISHYACSRCGRSVPSRFLFDERVFDAAYFRERMRQSRERRIEQRRQLQHRIVSARSQWLVLDDLPGIGDVPGLLEDLSEFISQEQGPALQASPALSRDVFDLTAYEAAIRQALTPDGTLFSDIPPLSTKHRLDKARRFVGLIFMEHVGEVLLTPFGQTDILVMPREAHG